MCSRTGRTGIPPPRGGSPYADRGLKMPQKKNHGVFGPKVPQIYVHMVSRCHTRQKDYPPLFGKSAPIRGVIGPIRGVIGGGNRTDYPQKQGVIGPSTLRLGG